MAEEEKGEVAGGHFIAEETGIAVVGGEHAVVAGDGQARGEGSGEGGAIAFGEVAEGSVDGSDEDVDGGRIAGAPVQTEAGVAGLDDGESVDLHGDADGVGGGSAVVAGQKTDGESGDGGGIPGGDIGNPGGVVAEVEFIDQRGASLGTEEAGASVGEDQGSNPHPLPRKLRILTTGLPGKSQGDGP